MRPSSIFSAIQACALLVFVYVKLSAPWPKGAYHTGDNTVWRDIAAKPIGGWDFWTAHRPFTVPLLHKLFDSEEHVVLFQSFLAIVSWAVFAYALSRCAHRRWLRSFLFVLTLALALTTPVHAWDVVIRSESVAASLLVLFFAAVLRFHAPPYAARESHRKWWAALALLAALFAAFARDTAAYLIVLVCAFMPLLFLVDRLAARSVKAGTRVVLFAGLLGIAVASMQNAKISKRDQFPLMNVVFRRVLTSKERLRYFRDELGMPVSRALMTRRRKFASSDRRFAFRSPELAEFREWLATRGRRGYQQYLLSNLGDTAREAAEFFPRFVRDDSGNTGRMSVNPVTERVDAELVRGLVSEHPNHAAILSLVISLGGLLSRRRDVRVLGLFGVFCLVAGATQAYICFHGDSMEILRHGVLVGVLIRLGALVALVLMLNAIAALYESVVPAKFFARLRRSLRAGTGRRAPVSEPARDASGALGRWG